MNQINQDSPIEYKQLHFKQFVMPLENNKILSNSKNSKNDEDSHQMDYRDNTGPPTEQFNNTESSS